MIEKVAEYIKQWHMIEPGDCVIAGLSGGADSVCLCCVLLELSERMKFSLRVVHVEHGIRGEESIRDARFVEQFCKEHGLECVVHQVNVPEYAKSHRIGEEEAARVLRYEVFRKEADKTAGSRIALAHHMEDNAETMLFQMARGSGMDGLCGIRPVRQEKNITYIRPLLVVSRQEIELELLRRNQPYCMDATNDNLAYCRNRIRHNILPELTKVNAQAVAHLNQTAERMRELRDYMDEQLADAENRVVTEDSDGVSLHVNPLMKLPHILQTGIVRNALAKAAGVKRDLETCHIEAVLELAGKQSGRSIDLPKRLTAERSYDSIRIRKRMQTDSGVATESMISEQMLANVAQTGLSEVVRIGGQDNRFTMRVFPFDGNLSEIPQKMYTKWFDYDKIKIGFSIRTRRNQDFFVMDAEGHRKKLADYFINEKIPAAERGKILLIANGNEILWVVGWRMGRTAQVERETRMILELIYEGGQNDGL